MSRCSWVGVEVDFFIGGCDQACGGRFVILYRRGLTVRKIKFHGGGIALGVGIYQGPSVALGAGPYFKHNRWRPSTHVGPRRAQSMICEAKGTRTGSA